MNLERLFGNINTQENQNGGAVMSDRFESEELKEKEGMPHEVHKEEMIRRISELLKSASDRELEIAMEFVRSLTRK